MTRVVKIAVAGTHSTGKTTFMKDLEKRLIEAGHVVAYVHDSAAEARDVGFPILSNHTFESTAWLIAQAIRLETAATLKANVILIDRPVPDALGYLIAALRTTNRSIDQQRLERLEAICEAWVKEYDLIFATRLDENIPIGPGRDDNHVFRSAAGKAVAEVMAKLAPEHCILTPENFEESIALSIRLASGR
ncbi:AAA family ATPase [Pacificoceanicola onchidii]|uniref:AAA family ATPase n=1 Tax=Pacificoceanicola onchidii TaxID=2562685 RepID=UPI001F0ED80C|nr:AAA family ATPase [Pacificoceanicola onchidii]